MELHTPVSAAAPCLCPILHIIHPHGLAMRFHSTQSIFCAFFAAEERSAFPIQPLPPSLAPRPPAGKSYTLEGLFDGASAKVGVIPRAVAQVLNHMALLPHQRYKVHVTYCALSGDKSATVHDLLAPGSTPTSIRDTGVQRARLAHAHVNTQDDIFEVRLPPLTLQLSVGSLCRRLCAGAAAC